MTPTHGRCAQPPPYRAPHFSSVTHHPPPPSQHTFVDRNRPETPFSHHIVNNAPSPPPPIPPSMPHHYPLTCPSLPHPTLTTPCIPETLQPHTRTPRICILATLQCTHTPPRHFVPSPSSQLLECTTPTAPLPFATLHRLTQTPIFCLAPSHRQSVFRCLLRGRALALGTGGTNGHPCSLA